jgi:hypothetical protein
VIACGFRGAGAGYSDDEVATFKVTGGLQLSPHRGRSFGRDVRRRNAGRGDERKPSAASGRLTSEQDPRRTATARLLPRAVSLGSGAGFRIRRPAAFLS